MRITNTQKKELSEIFINSGLNILDFEISGQFKEFKIKFKFEYFYFAINIQEKDNYRVTILPVDDTAGYVVGGNWNQVKGKFKVWTEELYTELNTPTGWENFQSDNFLNAGIDELENNFSEVEKIQARQSIIELKSSIKTLSISDAELKIIENKLDELSIKIDDLKKFDWKSLFVGTIASLIMTLGLPPEISGMLWEYIKTAFSGLRLKS